MTFNPKVLYTLTLSGFIIKPSSILVDNEMSIKSLLKGWTGELQTNISQIFFLDLNEYHIFNNVLLNTSHRTTQIDHIIVSRYGIFVIETKNYSGWIYGKENEKKWTHVLNKNSKYMFPNPLNQNYAHTKSLSEVLRINHRYIYSIIKFCGNCKFKTDMPENVLKYNLPKYIKSKKRVLFSEGKVQIICQQLSKIKDNTSIFDHGRHIRSLKKRFNAP
jgi:restriction system protein